MFDRIKKKRQRKKNIQLARRIAFHLYLMGGPDLRGLSDDELLERMAAAVNVLAVEVRKIGLSIAEAAKIFQKLAQASKGCKQLEKSDEIHS